MRSLRGIIFDLDGTLLDTLRDIADSMNAALECLGYPPHQVADYRLMVGTGIEELSHRALPEKDRSDSAAAVLAATMRREYSARWAHSTVPYEGVLPMLSELSTMKVPMAILSNKADEFTRAIVQRFLGEFTFKIVLGMRPDFPRKPDPASSLHIAALMRLDHRETVFAGDSGTDMETARRAGMYGIGVLWGFRGREELVNNGAQRVISSPQELPALFRS
jgi:phosphoglycolate phosphatase